MKKILFTLCLYGLFLHANCQYNGVAPTRCYIEIGAGTSLIHSPIMEDGRVNTTPTHVYAELGRFKNRFAINSSYNFGTTYSARSTRTTANLLTVAAKADIVAIPVFRDSYAVLYGLAGPTVGTYQCIDVQDASSQNTKETRSSMGISTAIGAQLEFDRFVVGAKGLLHSDKVQFENSATPTNVGSFRVQLTLGFKIFSPNEYSCSTYN